MQKNFLILNFYVLYRVQIKNAQNYTCQERTVVIDLNKNQHYKINPKQAAFKDFNRLLWKWSHSYLLIVWTLCHVSLDSNFLWARAITRKPCLVYSSRTHSKSTGTLKRSSLELLKLSILQLSYTRNENRVCSFTCFLLTQACNHFRGTFHVSVHSLLP